MQELGDNDHVLECIEFLEDETYLYIVTPRACNDGTLKDCIAWGDANEIMDPERSHAIFCKMLRILVYLEEHGIQHRDLSPDNFLFLPPSPGQVAGDNLVVYDLAMSVRIPVNPKTQHRALIKPQGAVGTYPFMAPEIYADGIHDGVATDLWGVSVCLYCLLTNQLLYYHPCLQDISFCYFLHARGLSSEYQNARAMELMQQIDVRAATDARVESLGAKLL